MSTQAERQNGESMSARFVLAIGLLEEMELLQVQHSEITATLGELHCELDTINAGDAMGMKVQLLRDAWRHERVAAEKLRQQIKGLEYDVTVLKSNLRLKDDCSDQLKAELAQVSDLRSRNSRLVKAKKAARRDIEALQEGVHREEVNRDHWKAECIRAQESDIENRRLVDKWKRACCGWVSCSILAVFIGIAGLVAGAMSPNQINVPAPTAQHRYVREVRELTDSDKPLGMPQEAGRVEYTAGNGQRLVDVWVRVEREGGAE
ncbi:MAG: hypothetical protein NXI04_18865 [Planctomycetaceae bacterium]|nr:hypothetical protein [Planctomycetaceae bacterium]